MPPFGARGIFKKYLTEANKETETQRKNPPYAWDHPDDER